MSLALFAAAAREAAAEARALKEQIVAAGVRTASRVRAPITPAAVAKAVEKAIDNKEAPGLIKKLQKELKKK